MSLIHIAVQMDDPLAVSLLISHRADPNAKSAFGDTPLHIAAERNLSGPVLVLLNEHADPKVFSWIGDTPLHRAAANGSREALMAILSQKKVRPNIRDRESGLTPLHSASRQGQRETAATLLKYGASVNARDKDRETPLIEAARAGHAEVVGLLLASGASVDQRDDHLRTALMWAATKGDWPEVVKRLLLGGANPTLVDRGGNTALSRATDMGARKTVRLLMKSRRIIRSASSN